jgi:hypothetical protein
MVKRLFLGLGLTNFGLAMLSIVGIVVLSIHPKIIWGPLNTACMLIFCAFVLTWPCAVVAGVAYGLVAPDLKQTGERSMYCLSCGYMLVRLPGNRCPECGREFDPTDVRTFRRYLTRQHRRTLVLLAYWLAAAGLAITCLLASALGLLAPVRF